MGKNIMFKNLLQSIRRSMGRYIAITAIIALGASMFVGLRGTKSAMVATGQKYMDEQNMFDLRLLSTYGWTESDVETIRQIEGVTAAEGTVTLDAIMSVGDAEREGVYKLYAIPETVNKVYLLGGRMPEKPDECLMDGAHVSDDVLGTVITVSPQNKADTLDSLQSLTFTVVGYVSTPLYMDINRGSTTLGNGSVAGYLYLPSDSFAVDYFSEIDITVAGNHAIYTKEYDTAMDDMGDYLEPLLLPLAQARYEQVRLEAEEALADGLLEYEDGLQGYADGKRQVDEVLEDALIELQNAAEEIEANRKLLEDGQAQLEAGQKTLESNTALLSRSRQTLAESKAEVYAQLSEASTQLLENYKPVAEGLRQAESGLSQLDSGLTQLDLGITQLQNGISQLDLTISIMNTMLDVLDVSIETAQQALNRAENEGILDEGTIQRLKDQLQSLSSSRDGYVAQRQQLQNSRAEYASQLSDLQSQRSALQAQRDEVAAQKAMLDAAMDEINAGLLELEKSQKEADNQFAIAEAELAAGEAQLDAAQITLNERLREIEKGLAALQEAEEELAEGWQQYREGAAEASRELSDAQIQLCKALVELREARNLIDGFKDPQVYILARTTNMGYLSLNSNSDIVAGVSAVFPAFFLLVAALVCIITMTRMVEEERTQIGTLKALGYGNTAIIGKYLAYAGSAAVLGCGLGVVAGSIIFPMILWKVYGIIMNLTPNIVLLFDWALCIPVVLSYTALSLLVTWYCCRMVLREVPAELIRPKPPTSGKKIFLEYLPFWDHIKFLNKVMLRNIFRYRQRLMMMLLGIGGCTALLVTGFGVRDSIVDIVGIQFDTVTLFDMEVRFNNSMELWDQEDFREEISRYVDKIGFAYQSSMELEHDDAVKDVTMIVADESISTFFDFHDGSAPQEMPGPGEAMLSVGIAERMDIERGDTILLRSADMELLEVTVSGIFDNHVYNYAIIAPETVEAQWGTVPKNQIAYITVRDDQDVHYAGTRVSRYGGVMNVTISQDLAEQVGSMLEAMNLVVVTVVICAGMLAVIVLYNLTNINITERIREIATLKVLGFNAVESAAYVFKENLLLSGMGAFLGLFGGQLLLIFVMSQIQVDMVWFETRVLPMSFIWSIVLTMLSACVVDFLLYFKLDKINMAEALKSVE